MISTPFSRRVHYWMVACFPFEIVINKQERCSRFLEEALELVQSLGFTKKQVSTLVDYVYSRPTGVPAQEVGGVAVTLAALCNATNINLDAAAETELARVWTKMDQIREKQAKKPKVY